MTRRKTANHVLLPIPVLEKLYFTEEKYLTFYKKLQFFNPYASMKAI
jgi:hypothetical protein